MKVGVSQPVNGKIGGMGDLASLLGDNANGNGNFASLLKFDGNDASEIHHVDEGQGRRGARPREKQKDESQQVLKAASKSGIASDPSSQRPLSTGVFVPWRLESPDIVGKSVIGTDSLSPNNVTNEATSFRSGSPMLSDASEHEISQQRTPDEIDTRMAAVPFLNESDMLRASDEAIPNNRNRTGESTPTGNERQSPVVAQSQPITLDAGTLPKASIDTDASVLRSPVQPNLQAAETAVVEGLVAQRHEAKSAISGPDVPIGMGKQVRDGGLDGEEARRKTAGGPDGVVSATLASTSGGSSRGNSSDAHRGTPDGKGEVTESRLWLSGVSRDGNLAAPVPGSLAHGHAGMKGPAFHELVPQQVPGGSLKESAPAREVNSSVARLLGSAVRSDLRVGVQTEAFGRVTIQTNAQGGQLSAQLSLENAKESATLAAHLPAVEQKIAQQHNLATSVRLAGGFDGGASAGFTGRDQSGPSRRDRDQYPGNVMMHSGEGERPASTETQGIDAPLLGSRYLLSSRLDVTV